MFPRAVVDENSDAPTRGSSNMAPQARRTFHIGTARREPDYISCYRRTTAIVLVLALLVALILPSSEAYLLQQGISNVRVGGGSGADQDSSSTSSNNKYEGNFELIQVTDETGASVPIPVGDEFGPFVLEVSGVQRGRDDGEYRINIKIGNILSARMSVRRDGAQVDIAEVTSTRMRVIDPTLFALEGAVYVLLEGADTIDLVDGDDGMILTLAIAGSNGSLIFRKVET